MRSPARVPASNLPRVVIVGAGFGGLWAARALARAPVNVTLIDRQNYHAFLPLLYQVAAAELEPEAIAYPIRSLLRAWPRARFEMGAVLAIDLEGRTVHTANRAVPYDFLIVATGSESHYFGVSGAKEGAFPLKTLDEAVRLRNHVLSCFEWATCEADPGRQQRLLTFVIVGGGPTGVEFAGALAELVRGPLARDFPELAVGRIRIVLLEALDGLLPGLPEPLRAYALSRLGKMGVDVRLQARVRRITPEAVELAEGTVIPTETTVWTAGVRGAPVAQEWGLPITRGGRVGVLDTLQVPGRPEVYVIGDLAAAQDGSQLLPMIAPVAVQQGKAAGQNVLRQVGGATPQPFHYKDPGTLVTIGRNAAVAHVWKRAFTGLSAWILWLGVHIVNLIGFRNRLVVLINWAWDYLFYERAARLIIPGRSRAPERPEGPETPR